MSMLGVSKISFNNSDYNPFQYLGEDHFEKFDNGLTKIAVGADGALFAINSEGTTFTDHQGKGWHSVNKKLKLISLSSADMVMGVDNNNKLYRYVGVSKWVEVLFNDISGKIIDENIVDISVSSTNDMHIVTDGDGDSTLYRYIPLNIPSN